MGCHSLLQRIFPTQGSNLGLAHCRQILYHLSHQGSPQSVLVLSFRFAESIEKENYSLHTYERTIPPKNLAASEADFGTGCELRVSGFSYT